jgi:DNA invertase Pin-like site-specific DNA recombinase
MMTGKRIGYIRVSTTDQNPDRQLENVSLDKKFIDYASARSTDRPQLKIMLDFVREDDIVIVHSMDRFARNLKDLKQLVDSLVLRNIQVHFIKENLQFSGENSAVSNLVLHLMGAFAEFEYAFIRERQREGVEIAKRLGRFKGGVKKMTREKIEMLKELIQTRKSKTLIAKELGVSRFTLYRYLKSEGIVIDEDIQKT